jgi:hypothetical protein
MSITSMLLRFARKVVGNVLSQLTKQLNVVQEMAYQPMQQMVQQVTSGVWVGKGADAFVEEVSSIMMPGVGKIGDGIGTTRRTSSMQLTPLTRLIRLLTIWSTASPMCSAASFN